MAYLEDLVGIGVAKDPTAVARRFIEDGILDALAKGLIAKRSIDQFPTTAPKSRKRKKRDQG
jgi:hypothetical protein